MCVKVTIFRAFLYIPPACHFVFTREKNREQKFFTRRRLCEKKMDMRDASSENEKCYFCKRTKQELMDNKECFVLGKYLVCNRCFVCPKCDLQQQNMQMLNQMDVALSVYNFNIEYIDSFGGNFMTVNPEHTCKKCTDCYFCNMSFVHWEPWWNYEQGCYKVLEINGEKKICHAFCAQEYQDREGMYEFMLCTKDASISKDIRKMIFGWVKKMPAERRCQACFVRPCYVVDYCIKCARAIEKYKKKFKKELQTGPVLTQYIFINKKRYGTYVSQVRNRLFKETLRVLLQNPKKKKYPQQSNVPPFIPKRKKRYIPILQNRCWK